MICPSCNTSRHTKCQGKNTWCDCCGSETVVQAASPSDSRTTQGGRVRSARSAPAPRTSTPRKARVTGGPCSVPGCNRPVRARGVCNTHYMRHLRHGDKLVTLPASGGRRPKATAEQVANVIALYERGFTQQEVADLIEVLSRDQVRLILAKRGLLREQPLLAPI